MIEVSHLTKKYGSRLAVDDISFTVEDGVIYGLLGPNGAESVFAIALATVEFEMFPARDQPLQENEPEF